MVNKGKSIGLIGAGLASLALAFGGCGDKKEVSKPSSSSPMAANPVDIVFRMFYGGGEEDPVAVERNKKIAEAYEIIMQDEYASLRGPLEDPERIYFDYDWGDFEKDFRHYSKERGEYNQEKGIYTIKNPVERFLNNLQKDPRKTIGSFVESVKDNNMR